MHSIKVIGQWGAERIINNKSEQTQRWPTNKIKNNNNKKNKTKGIRRGRGENPLSRLEKKAYQIGIYMKCYFCYCR